MAPTEPLSTTSLLDLYESLESAAELTLKSTSPLLKRLQDHSSDFSNGLSLLLIRPTTLLSSIHHLIILLGLQLTTITTNPSSIPPPTFSSQPQTRDLSVTELALPYIQRELSIIREVMDKTKGLEGKVAYQVKKLVALAESAGVAAANGSTKEIEDDQEANDPLSFRPNPAALLAASKPERKPSTSRRDRRGSASSSDEDVNNDGVYRPPRVAAVPYNEMKGKSRRTERRAPALLSEFASSLTSAPLLESTSGLSVRPAVNTAAGENALHSNSKSANRLAELARMTDFEEENMTRLVMTKRESKRREEDEAALNLGFGVGGEARSRSRRQGGFEAELEGVLGDRGGKGMWDSVGRGSLGRREGLLERSRKRGGDDLGGEEGSGKKGKFQRQVKKNKRK